METTQSPNSDIKPNKTKRNPKIQKTKPEDEEDNDKQTEKPETTNKKINNDLICNNFVLLKQIGHGAFGEIFLSFNLRDNIEVAIKREQKRIGKSVQLKTEAKVYQSLLNISQNQDLTGSIAL